MLDQLKLHAVVLAWGLTAVLGRLIHLPALELVVWRTGLTALMLAAVSVWLAGSLRVSWKAAAAWMGSGCLIGLHWLLFFKAGDVSNASVSLAGLPTTIVWCSLLEWLFFRKRPPLRELLLGALMVPAAWLILHFQATASLGLVLSVLSAVVGSVFGVLNGQFAQRGHYAVISFYQMVAACGFCAVALLWRGEIQGPTASDLGWLLVLSGVCTVYAYTAYVELLRRLSVFMINLVYNLEPVYGILLAAVLLGEHHDLHPGFFVGVGITVAAVIIHPWLEYRRYRRSQTAAA